MPLEYRLPYRFQRQYSIPNHKWLQSGKFFIRNTRLQSGSVNFPASTFLVIPITRLVPCDVLYFHQSSCSHETKFSPLPMFPTILYMVLKYPEFAVKMGSSSNIYPKKEKLATPPFVSIQSETKSFHYQCVFRYV